MEWGRGGFAVLPYGVDGPRMVPLRYALCAPVSMWLHLVLYGPAVPAIACSIGESHTAHTVTHSQHGGNHTHTSATNRCCSKSPHNIFINPNNQRSMSFISQGRQSSTTVSHQQSYSYSSFLSGLLVYVNNNTNKRPLTPKSMPPAFGLRYNISCKTSTP